MSRRVLVVDDEKLIVKGIRFSLEQDGYDVDCAYDGEEALKLAKENAYDIILLDVMLPKYDGFEVCQQIREYSDVPIIMLTAKGDDMDKILGLDYGADDYITKPFNILEVKARIKAIMRRVSKRDKNQENEKVIVKGEMKIDCESRRVIIGEKEINLYRDETCDHCHGDGAEPGSKVETCPECHGSGYVRFTQNTMFGQMVNERPCSKCHGEGKIISNPCKECRGKGTVKKNKRLKVKIPAGVDNGSRLRVSGEGEAGAKGGQSGDLYVYLYVKPHKFFERDGTTVLCEVPVNIVQATLGAEIKVPTLDGQVTVKVPEGTQPGKVLRLKGKGIPSLRGGQRGDQLVRIKVVVPTKLNEKQKEALRSFGEISKDNISPEEKSFFNKIKNLFK